MDAGTVQFLLQQAPTAALALVILVLFLAGKIHSDSEYSKLEAERDYWREAAEKMNEAAAVERRTATELAQAGTVTNQLIAALTRRADAAPDPPLPRSPLAGLTGEDVGL